MSPITRCNSCGLEFEVAEDLIGGYAGCPQCQKATPVEGLKDPLWRLLQAGILVALLVVSWLVLRSAGPWAAAGVFVGGLALAWLISRGL